MHSLECVLLNASSRVRAIPSRRLLRAPIRAHSRHVRSGNGEPVASNFTTPGRAVHRSTLRGWYVAQFAFPTKQLHTEPPAMTM